MNYVQHHERTHQPDAAILEMDQVIGQAKDQKRGHKPAHQPGQRMQHHQQPHPAADLMTVRFQEDEA